VSEGRGEGNVTIQIVGLMVGGQETPFDGEWLVLYDPKQESFDPEGTHMIATIGTTSQRGEAMRFKDLQAARREWMRWDGTMRPDGRPSRPLTAFNVQIEAMK